MKHSIYQIPKCALACSALLLATLAASAQTTNYMIYNFNTDQVTGIWGNWFGGDFVDVSWDNTVDATPGNPTPGSMKVDLDINDDQYVLNDGLPAAHLGYSLNMVTTFSNLSFDILFSTNSAIRTNVVGVGTNGSTGVGSLDYGYMRVGASDPGGSWDQDWFYFFAIPATNGAGQPNTNWTHISIPIVGNGGLLSQQPLLDTIDSLLFGIDGNNYNNNVLSGPQTYWVDNIQFIGPVGGNPLPPPVLTAAKATPALRLFGGSGGQYSRSQLTTIDESQSWIDNGGPVSYSFTLLNDPTNPGNLDCHIFFLPLNWFNGEPISGNHDMDYHILNTLWLRVQSGTGTPTCTADISWKTNHGYFNPNHTDLLITNPTAVGTWTITFNNNSSGTVTAPGASPVPFTLSDPNIEDDFGGGMILSFGNQCNGSSANEGVPNDWAKMSVTGLLNGGFNENDDWTTETSIDPTVWDISNSNTTNSVVLVTADDVLWIEATTPIQQSLQLEVAPTLNKNGPAWQLPEFYNSFAGGTLTNLPVSSIQGSTNWTLVPSECFPTVNGQVGGTPSTTAYFQMASPGPAVQ